MRSLHAVLSTALLLATAGPLLAQEDFTDYASKEDFFTITFPGKPTIMDGTWVTERGVILPSKIYTVDEPHGHHVLTVVDYTPVERVLTQKSHERCPDGADTCLGLHESGLGYWKDEYRGGVNYAISTLLVNQDVRITQLIFKFIGQVGGLELRMTNPQDQSRTVATAYMRKNRLFLLTSTTPKGWPESWIMQNSISWTGTDGGTPRVRLYRNDPDIDEPGATAPSR
jgi:hypothetical protein